MPDLDTGATTPARERAAFNEATQRMVAFMNAQLAAYYQGRVNNWIGLQSHGPTNDPVPDPPTGWAALPKQNLTQIETNYDTTWGLPPMLVPTATSDPVAPKYVPPSQPGPVTGPIIGVSLGGGWWSAGYVIGGHEIQDRSPAGVQVTGMSHDGVSGTFEKHPAFVGPGWWLRIG